MHKDQREIRQTVQRPNTHDGVRVLYLQTSVLDPHLVWCETRYTTHPFWVFEEQSQTSVRVDFSYMYSYNLDHRLLRGLFTTVRHQLVPSLAMYICTYCCRGRLQHY